MSSIASPAIPQVNINTRNQIQWRWAGEHKCEVGGGKMTIQFTRLSEDLEDSEDFQELLMIQ